MKNPLKKIWATRSEKNSFPASRPPRPDEGVGLESPGTSSEGGYYIVGYPSRRYIDGRWVNGTLRGGESTQDFKEIEPDYKKRFLTGSRWGTLLEDDLLTPALLIPEPVNPTKDEQLEFLMARSGIKRTLGYKHTYKFQRNPNGFKSYENKENKEPEEEIYL